MPPPLDGVYETCLYVPDVAAARSFYERVLGARTFLERLPRHAFMQLGRSLLFLFEPSSSRLPTDPAEGIPVPTHGAEGAGHVAFRVDPGQIEAWAKHLEASGVAIEERIVWPHGAVSLYFRDPGGNSLEVASSALWADEMR